MRLLARSKRTRSSSRSSSSALRSRFDRTLSIWGSLHVESSEAVLASRSRTSESLAKSADAAEVPRSAHLYSSMCMFSMEEATSEYEDMTKYARPVACSVQITNKLAILHEQRSLKSEM